MYEIDKLREKALKVVDPNDPYTEDDFNKEFYNFNNNESSDMFKLKINFKNESTNPDPEYATSGSSGFDLRANLSQSLLVSVGKRVIVPTGLFFEIPEGCEIQIRPRSGLAAKNGVTVLNTPGTIDSDYRGEIKIILINLGDELFEINHGDRIAQAIIAPIIGKKVINFNKVSEIYENTERGSNGFGSTGKK